MSGPIFGNTSALGGSSGGNRHLVEFRAGRMNMVGKMVHPDTRKGLVYMYQAEDGLIHFCWKDRTTGNIEDDLIIFPDDCEFKKIDQCKTGRVYLLKFKSSSRKLFFWLQEPKTDKDEEWCRRVNEVMNNPPSMNSVGSTSRSGGGGGGTDGGDLQYMLNNMSQQQLMQLFGGVGQMGGLSSLLGSMNRPSSGGNSSSPRLSSATTTPNRTTTASTTAASGNTTSSITTTTATPVAATTAATTTATTPQTNTVQPATPQAPKRQTRSSGGTKDGTSGAGTTSTGGGGTSTDTSRVLLTELQNYLSGLNPSGSNSRRNVDLATGINSEAVESVLSDPNFVTALQNHLPNIDGVVDNKSTTGGDTKTQLKQTLTSPQFQQALSMFSSALQSGQLGPVVSQFQFSPEVVAAANSGDLEQFVKALEKTVKNSDDSSSSDAKMELAPADDKKDDAKNDEDDPMK